MRHENSKEESQPPMPSGGRVLKRDNPPRPAPFGDDGGGDSIGLEARFGLAGQQNPADRLNQDDVGTYAFEHLASSRQARPLEDAIEDALMQIGNRRSALEALAGCRDVFGVLGEKSGKGGTIASLPAFTQSLEQ
jgi:hypothetical protein